MRQPTNFFYALMLLFVLTACKQKQPTTKTAPEILQNVIQTIDTIETIYYKQDMSRTNPRSAEDTIFRYREMYFKRLKGDSIVGVKGHWDMYVNDKKHVIYEDIYDGDRLIRKNNRDSVARVYDLIKYPDFKKTHFWSHNTLYGMQHEFRFFLKYNDQFLIEKLSDTVINNKDCYQISVQLQDYTTMPGFSIALVENKGMVSKTVYAIDKATNYPIRMRGEFYSVENASQMSFIDQRYYDIKFNAKINENTEFNTSIEPLEKFKIMEMKPE